MYLRFSHSCTIFFIYLFCTTLAKSNGPRPNVPRRHHRRAAGPSEFLTPPSPPPFLNQPPFPNGPVRHPKNYNPSPPPPTEAPGYLSKFMRWLNPFGRELPVAPGPSLPKTNNQNIHSEYLQPPPPPPPPPQNTYRPPLPNDHVPRATQYQPPCVNRPDQVLPQPPVPPPGQSYSPGSTALGCGGCNSRPWVPIQPDVGSKANTNHADLSSIQTSPYDLANHEGVAVQAEYHAAPNHVSQEVRPPDFGYGVPGNLDQQVLIPQINNHLPPAQFESPFTGPLPNPHIYPGAIPPLYKATVFRPSGPEQEALHSEVSSQLVEKPALQDNQHNLLVSPSTNIYNQVQFPGPTAPSNHPSDTYVDILPPSAEVATGLDQNLGPSGETHDNGGSGSDSHQVVYSSDQHDTSVANQNPAIDNFAPNTQNYYINDNNNGRQNDKNLNVYGTKLSTEVRQTIHVEQSPLIDLSRNKTSDSSASSSTSFDAIDETPVILQNADGTYGINATWPTGDSSRIVWPSDNEGGESSASAIVTQRSHPKNQNIKTETERPLETASDIFRKNEFRTNKPNSQNISSILIKVFKNSDSFTDKQRVNTSDNYNKSENHYGGEVKVEEPFIDALMKSYNNFEKEVSELKKPRNWLDGEDALPDPGSTSLGMSPRKESSESIPIGQNRSSKAANNRLSGGKKNKQVQIIIPYTSQYTPGPFHPSQNQWIQETTNKSAQGRKTDEINNHRSNHNPIDKEKIHAEKLTDKDERDFSYILEAIDNLPKVDILKIKSSSANKANTSIDVLRLQKNIDNWTIQEYSKGTTASTASPNPSHPHLTQSKKIPEEYLTTTEPVTITQADDEKTGSETDEKEANKGFGNVLAGFNFNDLEHEGSASSRVDVPHIRVSLSHENPSMSSSELDSITSGIINSASSEDGSWEQFPVSISPLSNERVYVVTPQTALKPTSFNSNSTNEQTKAENEHSNSNNGNSTTQFDSIERAYQVLPQAVNNLAVASTGPATVPLWGIMEHEEYASKFNNSSTQKSEGPTLYTGHSKVSHVGQ